MARRVVAWLLVVWAHAACVLAGAETFQDGFDDAGILEESGSPDESTSREWWLNSGARFVRENGIGRTIRGPLPEWDRWRAAYARSNPRDTDGGYLPQNLFRLITRRTWYDSTASVAVRIRAVHLTETPERDRWSGVLLFSRYVDAGNLYYAGVRHDGTAVVKRKHRGSYVTLAERPVIDGRYDRQTQPNLLPLDRWFGLRLHTRTIDAGVVALRLDVWDLPEGSGWTRAIDVRDDGSAGGRPLDRDGSSGIRSDYMDVELDAFEVVAPD